MPSPSKKTRSTASSPTKAKQSTLGFNAARPGAKANKKSIKGKAVEQATTSPTRRSSTRRRRPASSSSDEDEELLTPDEHESIESFSEEEEEERAVVVPPRRRATIRADVPLTGLSDKYGRWNAHLNECRSKRNHAKLIHGQGQNKIDEILRVFDLNDDFGPCIGVTRLERWQRADALGLGPPVEVHEILLTAEAKEDPRYAENIFMADV